MSRASEKVIIIIPTYNEASVISETITAVLKETSNTPGFDCQLLIFDSNSTDGSPNKLKHWAEREERLHFQSEPIKSGLGAAYLQSMRYAMDVLKADIVFEYDADGSHKPEYIKPMLDKLAFADVVVGSRYVEGGAIPKDWGAHRKLLSKLGNQVARLFLTNKYKDFTSGFRATRTLVLNKILPEKFLTTGYAYKLQLFWLLHKVGAVITEHPIIFIDREKGYSKLPSNSIIDSLRVLIHLRVSELQLYIKMCMVGLSGVLLQFGVFNFLRSIVGPTSAIQIAVMAAIISNFVFNNMFTFKNAKLRQSNFIKRFILYAIYSYLMVMSQSAWMYFAIKHIGQSVWFENFFVAIGIIAGSVLNYFFYSKIVWLSKKAGDFKLEM